MCDPLFMHQWQHIEHLGLEATEAKVYTALLDLGPSTVTEITKKAGVTRTLGYHILQKLCWHGLADSLPRAHKRLQFSATHPRRLVQYVAKQHSTWAKRVASAEELLPELVASYRTAEKPIIRYQEGSEGLMAIYAETLQSTSEILSILDIEGWNAPEFRQWGKRYNRERSAKKIHERILMLDTPLGREWMKTYQGEKAYTNYRWITRDQLHGIQEFGGELNVFENKTVMAIHQPRPLGIIIESGALARVLKGLFELAWQLGMDPSLRRKNSRTKR